MNTIDNKKISELRKIFNEINPAGVYFADIDNYDEYDPEIEEILKKYDPVMSETHLMEMIKEILNNMFDVETLQGFQGYETLARRVTMTLQGHP